MSREARRFSYGISTIIVTSLLCVISSTVYAQNPFGDVQTKPGDIAVTTLTITQLHVDSDFEEDTDENEYIWKFWYPGIVSQSAAFCEERDSVHPGTWGTFDRFIAPTNTLIVSDYPNHPSVIGMEGYEDDQSPTCQYDAGKDDAHCISTFQINYYNYAPIVQNVIDFRCDHFYSQATFEYSLPKPALPNVINVPATENYCGTAPLKIRTQAFFRPDFINTYYTFATWQYRAGSSFSWTTLGNSNFFYNPSVASTPIAELDVDVRVLAEFRNMTQNTDIYFRVITNMMVGNTVYPSVPTDGLVAHISPLGPTILSADPSVTCPGSSTGKVLMHVAGRDDYRWIVRQGENTTPCDPSLGNCGLTVNSGYETTQNFEISNIGKGRFTILVANPGANAGACFNTTFITMDEIPLLQFQPPQIDPVSCPGGSDGFIKLVSGGGIGPYSYTLNKDGSPVTGEDGEFSNLAKGDYVGVITDGCSQIKTSVVKVTEPMSIIAALTPINPTCTSPFDGSIMVDISQGEGMYNFQLLKDGEVIDQASNQATDQWQTKAISAGTYSVKIIDSQHASCPAYNSSTDLIQPNALSITQSDIMTTDLSCFGQKNGSIKLSNVDGSGLLKFTITGTSTGDTQSLTTTTFQNLAADQYSLVIKRNNVNCNDQFNYGNLIEVKQPENLTVTLTPSDVSCADRNDGKIDAAITGSNATDSYVWEKQVNGVWSSLSFSTASITNISGGNYRMKINNASNCHAESDVVTVREPDVLAYTSVKAKDILCFGESGQVETILTGGTEPYSHQFTSPGNNVESSTTITNLGNGTYSLTTKDKNGCTISYPDVIVISAPTSALTAKYIVSDYNGFNISCKGAANGIIDFTPSGGNGPGFSGYTFAMDDGEYSSASRIKSIPAGSHVFHVLDGRGCMITVPYDFKEPAGTLNLTLINQGELLCANDDNGTLVFEAEGGSAPYTFKINDVKAQDNGKFTDLVLGDYTVVVTDANGCSESNMGFIRSLYPPIEIAFLKTDAKCFGKPDGSISLEITGGTAPLFQEWTDGTNVIQNTGNLPAGTYTVKVSDNKGCEEQKTITISQPEDITAQLSSLPICVGKTTGEIQVRASGGTGSLLFSADGSAFQKDTILKGIAAGSHDITVKDDNGCEHVETTVVTTRNDQPKPDFLVASNQNALDTLVIDEISIPKPDSVEWTFDPKIMVVKEDSWAPEIKVAEAGSYTVAMKGYFGGCDYTTQLTLTINPYDPQSIVSTDVPYSAIKTMKVTPNPNAGDFTVSIELNSKQRLSLDIIDITGASMFQQNWDKTISVDKQVHLDVNLTGVYIIRAITETDAQEVRIVINK